MSERKGSTSINTENIFPIIKKWLYSEKDIFIREIISNGSDAINKMKKLVAIGEAEVPEGELYRIDVIVDKKAKTITFKDNGLGMTEEEVIKYINQIAFSGALDFVEKYKDKTDDDSIIGHFGLGFYSAFMAADKVEINTLSYQKDAKAVLWSSEEGTEYEIVDSDKETRGTDIILHIDSDSKEFLDETKVREVVRKYFAFLPVEIFINEDEKPVNDISPLWLKSPKECTDEEYKEFFHKVFNDYNDPLFWIHLNMEYPFTLKGILYFPKLRNEYDTLEGTIKLYYNQVFVADNIKEVIPEFLMLLKGTLDCPDLPLNVSRSFLQNDGYVSKISNHITKKVADKLKSMFDKDRETYDKYWEDINPFVKYGCMREEKFYDKVKGILIYKNLEGEYPTLDSIVEKVGENGKIYYVSDEAQQAQYINLFKESGQDAVIMNTVLDSSFVSFIESKLMDKKITFARIDSELSDKVKSEGKDDDSLKERSEKAQTMFRDILGKEKLQVKVESLISDAVPAMILLPEQSRRLKDMSRLYKSMDPSMFASMFDEEETLVLNADNSLVKALENISEDENRKDDVRLISEHIYDLAKMGHEPLAPEAMTKFIERSSVLLSKIV